MEDDVVWREGSSSDAFQLSADRYPPSSIYNIEISGRRSGPQAEGGTEIHGHSKLGKMEPCLLSIQAQTRGELLANVFTVLQYELDLTSDNICLISTYCTGVEKFKGTLAAAVVWPGEMLPPVGAAPTNLSVNQSWHSANIRRILIEEEVQIFKCKSTGRL
jgi:hypothetical protein